MAKFSKLKYSEIKFKKIDKYNNSFIIQPLERGMANTIGNSKSLYVTCPSFEDLKETFKIELSPKTSSLYLKGILHNLEIKVKTSTSVFAIEEYWWVTFAIFIAKGETP